MLNLSCGVTGCEGVGFGGLYCSGRVGGVGVGGGGGEGYVEVWDKEQR